VQVRSAETKNDKQQARPAEAGKPVVSEAAKPVTSAVGA
jgi:hypothetical protein